VDKAIAALEAERAVLDLAIAKLKATMEPKAKPRPKVVKPEAVA
jgi:hypothetical protein